MPFRKPRCVWDLKADLGEGPVWLERERSLFFVDIVGRRLHCLQPDTGDRRSWPTPSRPCLIVPIEGGGLLCGLEDGLREFSPAGGFGPLHRVEPSLPENRLNDGCVDAQGRLWFGTMHDRETAATGSLYRLDGLTAPIRPEPVDRGYTISNGPAIDPVRHRLYHNESSARRIFAFDLSPEGELSNKRAFATLERGFPDGLTLDAEGTLWVGVFDGGCVRRFRPDGSADGAVGLPCSHVTKLAFGGPDLHTAYVTTGRKGLSAAALERQPLAGGLFAFHVDVPGAPQHLFRP